MTHPKEGHSEETSEELKTVEEVSKELELPKEEVVEEEKAEEEIREEETSFEWTCDICGNVYVYPSNAPHKIYGYHEDMCGQCYDRGLMWCIREAWKWRAQLRIDVLRKPKDE